MRRILSRGMLSKRRIVAALLSMSFIFGTMAITLSQATWFEGSASIKVYGDENLFVKLQVHHYTVHTKFAIMHAILKVQSNYTEDILVNNIHIESYSCSKSYAGLGTCPGGEPFRKYGEGDKANISVPGMDTTKMRLNMKAYNWTFLIVDTEVWSYYSITWTHGSDTYFKSGINKEDVSEWYGKLWPSA